MYLRATNSIAKDNIRSAITHRMTERWSIPERIISRSGFTDELLEYAEDHNILLVGMDGIVGRKEFPQLI